MQNSREIQRLIRINEAKRKAAKLTPQRKRQLEGAVERVVEQYGDTLKLLAIE
jgi:hypothetical protein